MDGHQREPSYLAALRIQARALVRGDPEGDLDEGLLPSLRAWLDFKQYGLMPYAGGIRDQDPAMMRDFRIIDAEVAQQRKNKGR